MDGAASGMTPDDVAAFEKDLNGTALPYWLHLKIGELLATIRQLRAEAERLTKERDEWRETACDMFSALERLRTTGAKP
jgi:hypothetical protein